MAALGVGSTSDRWSKPVNLQPLTRSLLATMALVATGSVHADALNDRFSLSLGTFLVTTDTTLRVDGNGIQGTPFNVEHELGYNEQTSFRVDGYWRFLDRHKIRIMYFDEGRGATRTLDRDIVFDGFTYPLNAQISSRYDEIIGELAYEYAFLRGEHYELAGSLGIHDIEFKLAMSVVASHNTLTDSKRADANGPLPVVGLHYIWQFTPKLNLDALAEFFALKVDQFDGNLQNYSASVVYMPWKSFGIGAGWNAFVTHVNVDQNSFSGNLYWKYSGLRIYVRFSY
jgi:hypothetical protein